ncbi:MAG: phosphoribosylamine--glycine ligase [Propionibacteriaceae bacterium]|nr:phosphoribosylamine--glycine ligase [Propionibacteriaceae bacterium]
MRVLVVGSGGREHALAIGISADPTVAEVVTAPGNPGTWAMNAALRGADPGLWKRVTTLDPLDGAAVVALAEDLGVNLVVIGPEAPLVAGVADAVRAAGIPCFGASKEAAQLEASKQFAKEIMADAAVPTARSFLCLTPAEVAVALDDFGPPYVVKNDGLAAGKGVVVTEDRAVAAQHAEECGRVVIEDYLDGPEVSLFALSDGEHAVPLLPAQDFKRAHDDDAGPNTGGMGAYAPLPWLPENFTEVVMERVITPTLAAMRDRGTPFVGLLYAGLAVTSQGLRVVEFNARFGDPETQVIVPLLDAEAGPGWGTLLLAAATGTLDEVAPPVWRDESAVVIVVAADGYPGTPKKGGVIQAIGEGAFSIETGTPAPGATTHIVQAGTTRDSAGNLVANGGRVLGVVGRGNDLAAARQRAYETVAQVNYDDGFHRHDIARRAAQGEIPTISADQL